MSLELFAYPWDVVDRGPERFAEECVELGIDRLHITTLYHSGKFLLPRQRTSKVLLPQPGECFVPLPLDRLPASMRPSRWSLADSGWIEDLAKRGLPLSAWTVFHHGSGIAARNPDLVVRNVFGDRYPFALCPSHPTVREYSIELARALACLGYFDRIDLETIGYLGYFHDHHHEVTAIPWGPLENFAMSLCFCDSCIERARARQIDVERLRQFLIRLLEVKFSNDHAMDAHPSNQEQIATMLALSPDLQEFVRMRMDAISTLFLSIRDATGKTGLSVFTSSFVGSPSNIWMEGVSLSELASEVEAFHLLAYTSDTNAVNGDLVFCLGMGLHPAKLNLTLNLGLPVTPSLAHARAKIDCAWGLGVRRFSFFNYGFLGEGRLGWIKEMTSHVRGLEEGA